jgi:hypothetical protein
MQKKKRVEWDFTQNIADTKISHATQVNLQLQTWKWVSMPFCKASKNILYSHQVKKDVSLMQEDDSVTHTE